MSNMLLYLHQRLLLQDINRNESVRVLVRRTLKSVARSTGARIHINKWCKALRFLEVNSHGISAETAQWLDASIRRELETFKQSHAISYVRVSLIWDYLTHEKRSESMESVLARYSSMMESDGEFFAGFISKLRFIVTDCDHVISRDDRMYVQGTEESWQATTTLCPHCVRNRTDLTQTEESNRFVLSAFAVSAVTEHGTCIVDNRNHNYHFHNRRQRWEHVDFSPYNNLIQSYHSSRSNGWNIIDSPWFRSHRRAFGVELEVETPNMNANHAAGKVHDLLNPGGSLGEYCYFERDGSIGEGFELITQPAGLDIHRDKMGLFLKDAEVKRGMRSHEGGRCGLHIHVGRQYVTQAQIYRIQAFLNDVRNEALVKRIARRYSNSYCRMKPELSKLSPEGKHTRERYEALNVTNSNTIEFRIFRGSLRYESVMAALEFVNALMNFCMPGQTSITDFNAIGFRKFLLRHENRIDTEHLRPYLSLNPNTDNEAQAA